MLLCNRFIIVSGDRVLHFDPDAGSDYTWSAETATFWGSLEHAQVALNAAMKWGLQHAQYNIDDFIEDNCKQKQLKEASDFAKRCLRAEIREIGWVSRDGE